MRTTESFYDGGIIENDILTDELALYRNYDIFGRSRIDATAAQNFSCKNADNHFS